MILFTKDRSIAKALLLLTTLAAAPAFASQPTSLTSFFQPERASPVFQIGAVNTSQGKAQDIGINGLIGDRFTVTNHHDQNLLLGLGYFVGWKEREILNWMVGINAFYLGRTSVKGKVIQEQLFTNLSYRYYVTNYPIYVAAKALFHTYADKYDISVDAGIGPNIIRTTSFSESSLDDGVTLPDNAFSGQTNVTFSATVGAGIRFNNVLGCMPIEVGYRFFYLGEGSLKKNNNQITNHLKTGNSYANALIISVSA